MSSATETSCTCSLTCSLFWDHHRRPVGPAPKSRMASTQGTWRKNLSLVPPAPGRQDVGDPSRA
jgi:hypothetical protein